MLSRELCNASLVSVPEHLCAVMRLEINNKFFDIQYFSRKTSNFGKRCLFLVLEIFRCIASCFLERKNYQILLLDLCVPNAPHFRFKGLMRLTK